MSIAVTKYLERYLKRRLPRGPSSITSVHSTLTSTWQTACIKGVDPKTLIKTASVLLFALLPREGQSAPLVRALLQDAQALMEGARFEDAQVRIDRSAFHLGKADKEMLVRGYRMGVLLAHARRDRTALHATISRLIAIGHWPREGEYPKSVLREWRLRAFVVAPLKLFVNRTRAANKWQVSVLSTGGSEDDLPVDIVLWVNRGNGWRPIKGGEAQLQADRIVTLYVEAIHRSTGVIVMRHGSSADPMVLFPSRT